MKALNIHMILMLMISSLVASQTDNRLFESLNTLYYDTDKLLKIDRYNSEQLPINEFRIDTASNKLPDYRIKETQLLQRELRSDLGLSFKATINHNLNNIFDEENNEFVITRYRAELEWQLLKNGFLSNRQRARQLDAQTNMLELEEEEASIVLWRRQFRLSYSYAIHRELIDLYRIRLSFLDTYFEVLSTLYSNKLIDRERIIRISYDIETTKQEISNYQTLNDRIKDSILPGYENIKVPFVTIADNTFYPEVVNNEKDSLALHAIALSHPWFEDISLSVYTNQNWINAAQTDRSYTAIGLRLRIPIKRGYRKAKRQNSMYMLKAQQADKSIGKYNQTLTHYNAYREKLKDLKEQYKVWQVVKERKRKLQLIKTDVDDIQIGIRLTDALLDQFEVLKNMLHIKRQIYTSLSHLYELDTDLQLALFSFDGSNNIKVLVGESSMFSRTYQIAFLQLKQIQTICVDGIDKEFRQQLEHKGFRIVEKTDEADIILLEDWMLYEQNQIKGL